MNLQEQQNEDYWEACKIDEENFRKLHEEQLEKELMEQSYREYIENLRQTISMEPSTTTTSACFVKIHMAGKVYSRRFLVTDTIQSIYDFVEVTHYDVCKKINPNITLQTYNQCSLCDKRETLAFFGTPRIALYVTTTTTTNSLL
jgi:hypothetical protein